MQKIPAAYLVPERDRATVVRALPELHYGDRLNLFEELVEGRVRAGEGARIAYHTPDGAVTYGDLCARVHRLSAVLTGLGVEPGDRVLLRMDDTPTLVAVLLATWRIGAVAMPTFAKFRSVDISYRERDAEARVMIVSDSLSAEVAVAQAEFGHVQHIVADPEASHPGHLSLAQLERDAPDTVDVEPTRGDDLAVLLYTSGSTGDPKGCYHTHAEVLSVPDAYGRYALNTRPDDVFAGPPPLGFALGFLYHVLMPLRFGASAVMGVPKTPADYLEALGKYSVSVLVSVPTFYNQLLNMAENAGLPWTGSAVRCVKSGGEPLGQAVFDRWKAWSGVPLTNLMGFTEVLHDCISYREDAGWERSTALGRAMPGWQIVIRDLETFEELPRGEYGVLTMRGPTSTTYWRKPENQLDIVRNGWNCFHDMAAMDDRGLITFQSRKDDIIVASGYNIAPGDVENVLLTHPDVRECAVVGAPDPTGVRPTIVKAVVVLAAGADSGPDEVRALQDYFKLNGAPHMYPRAITFVDALPTTASGKLNRTALR